MPSIVGLDVTSTDLGITEIGGQRVRIRQNQIAGLTPEEVEAKFNALKDNFTLGKPYKAFLKCFSTDPFLYAIIVLDKTAPDPVGEWWL